MSAPKHILVVTYWSYKNALINTYTLPYLELMKQHLPEGSRIYLMTLTPRPEDHPEDRKQKQRLLQSKGIELLNFTYQPFGLGMVLKLAGMLAYLTGFIFRKRIRVIHAWCTPGGAIAYFLSKFTGRPLVLDSFEPHAESMLETGTWKRNSLAYRALFRLETWQLARAREVICAASGMISYSQNTYGITKDRYFVKPACVDLELFDPAKVSAPMLPGIDSRSVVCVYAGKFGDIYLKAEVFDFFAVARAYWGDRFKVLLLTSQSDDEIKALSQHAGLPPDTIVKRFVQHHEVPAYMAAGSFGVCPVKPVPTKRYCTPIKNGEYWAMGLPVVITDNISTDSELIHAEGIGYVLRSLDAAEYLRAVKRMDALLHEPGLRAKIRAVAVGQRNYNLADAIYATIYCQNYAG